MSWCALSTKISLYVYKSLLSFVLMCVFITIWDISVMKWLAMFPKTLLTAGFNWLLTLPCDKTTNNITSCSDQGCCFLEIIKETIDALMIQVFLLRCYFSANKNDHIKLCSAVVTCAQLWPDKVGGITVKALGMFTRFQLWFINHLWDSNKFAMLCIAPAIISTMPHRFCFLSCNLNIYCKDLFTKRSTLKCILQVFHRLCGHKR